VYREPPPADAEPGVKWVRLADIGVVPLAERTTALAAYLEGRIKKLVLP
jgi:hypothetical protein